MKTTTYKQILTWNWDNIIPKDEKSAPVLWYWSISVFFDNDIYIRWKEWQNESLIKANMSPIIVSWATNNWFPFQVKWTWDLNIITVN